MKPIKQVHAPHLGRHVKFGRKRPVARGPRLKLASYLDIAKFRLPAPDCDYSAAAAGALSDVLANDVYGDCTCAGVGHIISMLCSNAGVQTYITASQAVKLYELSCGYVPGDASTDQGGDELTVLDYVAEHGIDGNGLHQICGSILIDGCKKEEVRWAQWALGNLYAGEELPINYTDMMPSSNGFVWDIEGEPDPEQGHCFIGYGSNAKGILIDTWGLLGVQTYEAVKEYATPRGNGELHSILTREWLNRATAKTPSGFAYDDLVSDLRKLGFQIAA